MICLLQRVSQARVEINSKTVGAIGHGLMVLVGFQPEDDATQLRKMAHKLLYYRLFADENDKINLNVQQIRGELLLVPQFTLAADTRKGLRPSFSQSAPPQQAEPLFNEFVRQIKMAYAAPQTGLFGEDMQVTLTNDGPVTFWLEV